jgi:tetratricopeptide (TPR) repeat protein/predicted Ser/Thr protein kinase
MGPSFPDGSMIGKTLGHYEIEALLGQGGMGEVYRARDSRLGRSVAIKVLNPQIAASADARVRLVREARALAAVHHPGIATLFGFESIDGHEMLVMELVDGLPLSAALREGPLDGSRVRILLARICEALAVAHDHGIVHRDLKPDNLMLLPGDEVKILDFGLALATEDTQITREGATLGTIAYMSPEQARGEIVEARSDLFSLGTIAWELVTGKRLFQGESGIGLVRRIADLESAPQIEADADLKAFIEACLQPDPRRRPASAEVARDLIVPSDPGTTQLRRRPRKALPFVLTAGFIASALVLAVRLWPTGAPSEAAAVRDGTLAVVPFQNLNLSADLAWFTVASAELLATTISGSPMIDVISLDRVRMILERTPGDAQSALAAAGVGYSIGGAVIAGGSGIRIETRLVNNRSGELIHSVVGNAADVDDLYEVVADLDRAYREFIEVRAISERLEEEWIQDLPTYSIEAYRAYARGREHLSAARWEPAITFFTEAVNIDSTFVSAWVDLSSCYWNIGDLAAMDAAYSQAMELRDRASPREQLWLDLYGAVKSGDGPLIAQYASEMLESEPEHRFVRYLLGKGYFEQQLWESAARQWEPLRVERWSWIWTYLYSSRALSHLERYAEARTALDELEGILTPSDDYARARLHRYRGLIALEEQSPELALAEFDRMVAIEPDIIEDNYDRARALLMLERHDEARALLEEYVAHPEGRDFTQEAAKLLQGLR